MSFNKQQNLAVKYFAQVMAKCERTEDKEWYPKIDDDFIQQNKNNEEQFFNIVNESFKLLISYWCAKYNIVSYQIDSDCISHLWAQIGKFNWEKMNDSFSYFNVIARGFIVGVIVINKRFLHIELQ